MSARVLPYLRESAPRRQPACLRWFWARRALRPRAQASRSGGDLHACVRARRVRAVGIPFSLVSTALGGAFRGMLDTRSPLAVAVVANAINLVLDPILIFGLGSVPALGAPGAAASTVVAEAVALALLLRQLRASRLWPRALAAPDWAQARRFVTAGAAVLTRTAALQSTLLLSTATVSRSSHGDAAPVAAHQVQTRANWGREGRQGALWAPALRSAGGAHRALPSPPPPPCPRALQLSRPPS